jgi:hypothetical protein
MPAPGRLMWSRRNASSRAGAADEAASVFFSSARRWAAAASITILAVVAASPERSINARPLSIAVCKHRLPSPRNPSCHCFNSMAPLSSDGLRASAVRQSPRGCRCPSGSRTRHRGPICRRANPIPPARNRCRTIRRGGMRCSSSLSQGRRDRPLRTERPRRMGLRGEVADGGKNLEDHPALAIRYVGRKIPFQRANSTSRRVEPFSVHADTSLPGTLHHSGIRPAPPSEDTPLARRRAFLARPKPKRPRLKLLKPSNVSWSTRFREFAPLLELGRDAPAHLP